MISRKEVEQTLGQSSIVAKRTRKRQTERIAVLMVHDLKEQTEKATTSVYICGTSLTL